MTQRQEFFKRSEKMFHLYGAGKFKEALAVVDSLATEFPQETARTDLWRICLLSVSGEIQPALNVMQKSVASGMWWSEAQLRADSDLAALQGNPDFESLVALCKERQTRASAQPELLVRAPAGNGPFPLLIALHGRSSSPEYDLARWEQLVSLGWLLAMPQSSQLGSPNSYVWDNEEQGLSEISAHYRFLLEKYPVDTERVVVAGFSQGAALAIVLTLEGTIPARGFLPVSPGGLNLERLETLAKSAGKYRLRGYIVLGGRDFRFDTLKAMHSTLSACGIPCMLEEHASMAHEFPADFDQTLQRAFAFIFEKKE